MNKPQGNCKICGTPLRAVGKARTNGKCHDDWAGREYHKKCWKENQHLVVALQYEKLKKFAKEQSDASSEESN
jgi:hypothetical protein